MNMVFFVIFSSRKADCFATKNPEGENFDTISGQQPCDKASCPCLFSTHHALNRMNKSMEMRDPKKEFVLSTKNWSQRGKGISKKEIEVHPMIAYIREE